MPPSEPGLSPNDSLVFADENKWASPDRLPIESTLQSTQIDQSPATSQLFKNGSYLFSHESDDVFGSPRSLKTAAALELGEFTELADTQVIGNGKKEETETRGEENAESTAFKEAENGLSLPNRPQTGDAGTIINDLQDTQIIHRLDDTQVIPLTETQIVPRVVPDNTTDLDTTAESPIRLHYLKSSLSQPVLIQPTLSQPVWGDTQPITQVIHHKSSPGIFDDTALILSPGETEPTTQVVNTQEELIESTPSVDLGCKPVFSSSQRDETKNDVSVVEEIRTDEEEDTNTMLIEDSVFRMKRKRKEASPVLEISEPKSDNFPRKADWSQSSSELEDISHDVMDIDLDMLCESSEQVVAPKKRRRNHVAATQAQTDVLTEEPLSTLVLDSVKNTNSVWAFSQFKHYPARVVDTRGDLLSFVEFADGARLEVKNSDLFILDLRVGDMVRVNGRAGEYVVTGLTTTGVDAFACVRGFDTAFLAKKGRHNAHGKEFPALLTECFMEISQWALHQQTFQLMCNGVDLVQENFGVIRTLLSSMARVDKGLESKSSPRKLALEPRPLRSRLLEGVFFFVTSIEGERKDQLLELITANGGVFIDDEIKQYVSCSSDGRLGLFLKTLSGFKFGALLADGHSRSAKYLQALALGWPILADCFVDQALLDPLLLENWPVFLLPAGLSHYTNGIKSMDILAFRNNFNDKVDMNLQLSNNADLLAAHSILVLNRKQDSKTLDMCGFIFHAFGASSLTLFDSAGEIDAYLQTHTVLNVLVYDNNTGEFSKAHAKKRKKASRSNTMTTEAQVAVIDWEWVVQCVISGYVWKPSSYVEVGGLS